ncbi:MAG: hypothetical protein KDC34_10710 [Saprospiraceae bacterium]|nr:hypothetical protein [Saprospiraceae bacterium]
MADKWNKCCTELLDLVEASQHAQVGGYDHSKLQALIYYLYSHTHSLEASRHPDDDPRTRSEEMLMELPVEIRREVLLHAARDLQMLFPERCDRLIDCITPIEPSRTKKNTDKLNQYLRHIDASIHSGRYTLALKLTNRCLKEYYRAYLKTTILHWEPTTENVQWMSISVVRDMMNYFRTHSIPYSERRMLLMTTVSNVLHTTMARLKSTSGKYAVDKAIAIYARNNMKRIAKFLSRYF